MTTPRPGRGAEFAIKVVGRRPGLAEDVFHRLLVTSWVRFFSLVAASFVLGNALFAALYLVEEGSIAGARVGSFADAFFFSVQTGGTIGYGVMHPATTWAHLLVTAESLASLLGFALVTGITYAKFARPQAKVLFTDKAVVGTRDGQRFLMLRMANARHNSIVEAHLRVVLLLDVYSKEGEFMRVPHELPLVRSSNPFFRLSWTASHRIDEASPFFGDDCQETLRRRNALLLLTMTGFDETLGQTVHSRYGYEFGEVVWGARFADVITVEADGTRVIDYRRFHDVVPEKLSPV